MAVDFLMIRNLTTWESQQKKTNDHLALGWVLVYSREMQTLNSKLSMVFCICLSAKRFQTNNYQTVKMADDNQTQNHGEKKKTFHCPCDPLEFFCVSSELGKNQGQYPIKHLIDSSGSLWVKKHEWVVMNISPSSNPRI